MLTQKNVKDIEAPPRGSKITYDHSDGDDPTKTVRGFGVRITAAGAKAFILNYRFRGQERRITIGTYPGWSVAAARKEARDLRVRIDQGEDPLAERIADREAPTMRDLASRYLVEHAIPKKRPDSVRDDRAMLDKIILPALGSRRVADLRHSDIERLHAKVTARGSTVRANRVAALISKMLNLAIRWEMITMNPAKGIERNPENRRTRYLSGDELARLSEALAIHSSQSAANAVRLLLLTGARRMEVLGAQWGEFDFETGHWIKPSSHTKQKSEHKLPLSAPALKLLAEMREQAKGKFLFPGRDGKGHMVDLKTSWSTICRVAQLGDARLHDLRHTHASLLANAGANLMQIGALLGHTNPETTSRYAHHFDDPLRAATEHVGAIITGRPPAEVVRIRKGDAA
jgi:integrase